MQCDGWVTYLSESPIRGLVRLGEAERNRVLKQLRLVGTTSCASESVFEVDALCNATQNAFALFAPLPFREFKATNGNSVYGHLRSFQKCLRAL